ncbi:related to BEM2 - GTPase-activating protein [Ustilago trichophora]|uniref:Related to BEM2 - GTPase-activating protein n=1 Tax=Ustilago trichophora TaxID=86804 RepID=A0A5C3DWI7_9BASI|nr:related to BEM2 - GTPase-activating protein [Ustilago trichophora]
MPLPAHQSGQAAASSQQQQQQHHHHHQQHYFAQSQQHQYHHQQPQQQQRQQQQQQQQEKSQSQPIGRSQSAFNFLLNKAKAPFSSSSSSSTLNASTSLSSLSIHQEDPFDDTTNHIQYHRQLQKDHTFPQAPTSSGQARRVPSGSIDKISRAQQHQQPQADINSASHPSRPSGAPFSRPSYSEESQNAVASPTKRSFFGGIGRDRKASTASMKQPAPQKPNFSYSPLSKGHRPEPSTSNYAQFSKSQSDLHARADFPSPTDAPAELPRMPTIYQQNAPASADRNRYLRSPSPAMNFSRSVDDLSSVEQPVSPFPASPGYDESTSTLATMATSTSPGTWGEHGVPGAQADWRPSDMGTLASPTQQQTASFQRFKGGHNKLDSIASHVQPSTGSVQSPPNNWTSMSPPQYSYLQSSAPQGKEAKHARKVSKLTGKETGRGVVATSLAASLGLTNLGGSASTPAPLSIQTSSEPVPLPPGSVFQGFISRNANISLTLAQLSGHDHGKGKEKDIAKGWKPYRVVLQDGRLCFYKPPSNISDEVKTLFPAGVVRSVPDTPASSASFASLNTEALMRSGLSKADLLSATSSTTEMTSPLPSPSMRPRMPAVRQNSNKSATASIEPPATPSSAPLPPNVSGAAHRSWVKAGKHPDLVLVDSVDAPQGWAERVQSGSIAALAHEFVKATQFPTAAEQAFKPLSRRSIASPLIAQFKPDRAAELVVETFVVAVLTSISAGGEAALDVSKQINTFISEVQRRMEEAPAAAQDVPNEVDSIPSLKSRLATLLDVAVQAGFAQLPEVAGSLRRLAASAQLDGDDLDNKLVMSTLPVFDAEAIAASGPVDWVSKVAEMGPVDAREDLQELRSSLSISDALLLHLEPLEIAQQIQLFHADALRRLAGSHLSLSELLEAAKTHNKDVAALSFDSLSPHPITALALKHLLSSSSAGHDAPSFGQNGARHRASVLRHWIAVASYLLTLGDVAGWMAVCTALCSRAVTRLEQTWRYLAEGDRVLVAEEWAPVLSSISWTEGLAVNVRSRFVGEAPEPFVTLPDGQRASTIPFLGNALYRVLRHSESPAAIPPAADHVRISSRAEDAYGLWTSTKEWRAACQQFTSESALCIAAHAEPLVEYQATLQLLFRDAVEMPTSEFNMERSFQLEPKALGNLDARERHWLPPNANPCLPLVPLLFPQPLPLLSLLNATQIKAELFHRDDQRANLSNDPQATITSRSSTRPSLVGSPLIRSSAFSPPLGGRSGRSAAFNGVIEWASVTPTPSWEDPNNSVVKIGNELVLRVVQEPNLSLPNSPMTSKRFSQDFGRASRPLSQISKRSSLPASNRSSVVDIVVPVQVVVKAATLDRMIDLLVMGVQHISMPPSPSTIDGAEAQNTPSRKTRLVMDMETYRTTFLATFRSLCSPPELFEQLQKRFSTAITASKELAGADEFLTSSQFPSWIPVIPAGSQAEPTDWDMVYRIRMGVVLTLRLWIDRFPQDFVDDDVLYHLALSFLRQPGMEVTAEDPDQQKVVNALSQLRSMFGARIMGANARQEERSYAANLPVHVSNHQHQAEFDFDRATAAELVEYLESIATVFFDKIVDRDLLVVSEIFEKQASHPAAWFTVKSGSTGTGEEDKPVTNMYTMLDVLKACDGTSKDASQDTGKDATLQQKLPSAVRDALAAQSLFRGWIAIHIIESGIGLERRQERLSKLLDALWICRARMLRLRADDVTTPVNPQFGNASMVADTSLPFREPTIGSFVESAIVNTLGSSESRVFLRAWQGVAAARGAKGDGLEDLMPKQIDSDMRSATEMSGTPDIGWILACLAEVATKAPSIQTSAADIELVDFEKRRTMWALIDGAVRVRPACSVPDLVDLAGARLRLMQSALTRVIWDRRAFREDAANEMRNAPPVRSDARQRPTTSSKALTGLSRQQQEKLRRDRAALEMLNSLPLRPSITSRVSSMRSGSARASAANSPSSGSAPLPREKAAMAQAPPPDKATIRARRMTALFKGAVRPLISLDKPDAPAKSVSELMRLTPLQKPSIVAGLGGARVSIWNNTQRSFVFHLTSQEGAKYLLQTTNAAELAEWIGHIERASKEYAVHRPLDPRKGAMPIRGKAAAAPLYGRPLVELVEREGHSVPTAVERMFAEIEARGLREQGIYRISGSKSAVENLRRAWDHQPAESIDLSTGEFSDIHTIAGAVKTWLRELPEPLITFDSYDDLIATNSMENDDRLYAMRDIIWKMPKCHFDVLRRTAEHLARVVEEGEVNKMLAHNVALVFGTSLLNPTPSPSSVAVGFGNLGKAANVVKTIVTMHEWLFEPEPEPEPEAEVEHDVEAPEHVEQSTVAEEPADPSTVAVLVANADETAIPTAPLDLGRVRGASLSSSDDSVPVHITDSATLSVPAEHSASQKADIEGGDDESVSELPVRSRRGGRARPLTIVGLDGLSALGGTDSVAKVLESGGSSEAANVDAIGESSQEVIETVQSETDASIASQPMQAAPRIVLSGDGDSENEAVDEGSQSGGDDSNDIDGTIDETQDISVTVREGGEQHTHTDAAKAREHDDDDVSPGLAVASERPRKTRSSYRDSVFTSYSIYADCFDNMKLESQSSAASMVKRQSMHLLGQPCGASPEVESTEAKATEA